jgi:signal transduction histidine kinase
VWRWAPEIVLALALFVAVETEYRHSVGPWQVVAVVVLTVPLAIRLVWPVPVLVLVCAGFVWLAEMHILTGGFATFPVIAMGFALYAVGSRASWPVIALAAAVFLTAWIIALGFSAAPGRLAVGAAFAATGLLVGRAVGVLSYESDVQAERATRLELERDARAAQAVHDERQRIARELHDVIGHSISVMGVQAGAVRSVLRPDQQRESQALLAVERVGREAVAEMRRLLGLLRSDALGIGDAPASLRHAERLVEDLRSAGLTVALRTSGDLTALPPGADLAGFRILQESLTNAVKHGCGTAIRATVTCSEGALILDVVNDLGSPNRPSAEFGHGVHGMRERALLYGGEFTCGPTPDGQFAVHARIPLASNQ